MWPSIVLQSTERSKPLSWKHRFTQCAPQRCICFRCCSLFRSFYNLRFTTFRRCPRCLPTWMYSSFIRSSMNASVRRMAWHCLKRVQLSASAFLFPGSSHTVGLTWKSSTTNGSSKAHSHPHAHEGCNPENGIVESRNGLCGLSRMMERKNTQC